MNVDTERLMAMLGSEAAVERFVNLFQEQLPVQLNTIKESLESGDWETASLTAHGLKTQCRYFGLNEAADLLQQIESEPQNEKAKEIVTALNASF